mgnify:CR=1 FL=1
MDKENLQTKVEALQDNLKVKHDELTEIQQQLSVARVELANLGKTVISQDDVCSLVDLLQGMFHDILNEADTSDLSPEFSIGYDNTIELDCLDMSSIEVHACDIENVLEQVFNITDEDFINEDDSGKIDGKFA